MNQETNVETLVLATLRERITKIFPAQIIACAEELSQEQLWWRPNESSNSVANLLLHLSGSLRHYLSRTVGGIEYERDRPAEFAEREPLPKERVLAIFRETIEQAKEVFDTFDTGRFMDSTPEPGYNQTVFNLLYNVSLHLATHSGQVVYITKMLKEGSVDELWIRAHRQN